MENETTRMERIAPAPVGVPRFLPSVVVSVMLAACAPAVPPPAPLSSAGTNAATPADAGPVGVLGVEADRVRDLLGPPSFARRESPAQYWRYDFAGCALDLFLFQVPGEAAPRVVHAELRRRGPLAAGRDCEAMAAAFEPEALAGPRTETH